MRGSGQSARKWTQGPSSLAFDAHPLGSPDAVYWARGKTAVAAVVEAVDLLLLIWSIDQSAQGAHSKPSLGTDTSTAPNSGRIPYIGDTMWVHDNVCADASWRGS